MLCFDSHFVFAYILNCSTLTKFQFSVWSSAMPKETESIKKNLIPQNKVRPQIWVWLPDYQHIPFSNFTGFLAILNIVTSQQHQVPHCLGRFYELRYLLEPLTFFTSPFLPISFPLFLRSSLP